MLKTKKVYDAKYKGRENKIAFFATLKRKLLKHQLDCNTHNHMEKWWQSLQMAPMFFSTHYTLVFWKTEVFDASDIESVAKTFGKYDENRASSKRISTIPFQAGRKMA
jgi:peptidylprolyl isomerase